MLDLNSVSIYFSGESLFENISFKVRGGDKIGLIGKNGAGKSTLLKVIAGELDSDKGSISKRKEIKIGFLKQDIDFTKGNTVLDEAYTAFAQIKKLESQLDFINNELIKREDYESQEYLDLVDNLSEITSQYEIAGGYNYKGSAEQMLKGLGFSEIDFLKKTEELSGGWRMRIELAKLLLQQNDILLLDEPTNHLDIESIIFLEKFLNKYTGAVILVSHDKMFLDNVTNRTLEISFGRINDFAKGYSKYLEHRKELMEQQEKSKKNQDKEIEQTKKLIEKFRAKANKASMAQSLIKKLNKIDIIEVDKEDNSVMNISFRDFIQPGKVVVEATKICKSYDGNSILENIDLFINRGEKIAFVGQNGQGKSTLVKIIADQISFEGNMKLGHNVELGYFAQNQSEELNPDKTVLQIMEDEATDITTLKIRSMLGSFLFSDDSVDKKAKVLSGGERNRLAICKMLLKSFNVLIMDEPTNHLDMKSKSILKQALMKFDGTLILVSHDRDFLQGITDKIYEFKNKRIKQYLGDINTYLEQINIDNIRDLEKKTTVNKTDKTKSKSISYEEQKRLKSIKNRIAKTEREISSIEKQIADMDDELLANPNNSNSDFFEKYNGKKQKLDELMIKWEDLSVDL